MASGLTGVSGTAVAATAAGGLLVWSGIKGTGVSQGLRSVLSGQKPAAAQANPIEATLTADTTGGGDPGAATGPAPSGGSNAQNRALGKFMAAAYGWGTGVQWEALDWIAEDESGWSDTVVNPSSGAAGIAQNIAGFGPGYQSGNAAEQIAWFLSYIKGRYGNPVAAKAFHVAHGWY